MIITVAHQKGGTGKSTIATNLAVELRTSLLDLDKQHSSIIFNYKRQNAGLAPRLSRVAERTLVPLGRRICHSLPDLFISS